MTLICPSNSFAVKHERWCGRLLERPLTESQRKFVVENNQRIRSLEKEIQYLDQRSENAGWITRSENKRYLLWQKKIVIRQEVLKRFESEDVLQGAHYITVREILDAHANSIRALREYLFQLKRVHRLTTLASATEVMDLLGTPFLGELQFVLKYLSLAAITAHTHGVSQVKISRGSVETEFVRLQELLLIYDERMGKRYPILKGEMPHTVLALSLLDAFQVTPMIQKAIQPIPLSQVLSTVNLLRLSSNHKKIKSGTQEVRDVSRWLDRMSTRLEHELFLELLKTHN